MSRRNRTNTAGVSLFPFLDVLVCTMGSLILLLLVATNKIRTAAVERAKQAAVQAPPQTPAVIEPEPVAEPEEPPTAEWKTRVEQLADERDALQTQLAELKAQLESAQSTVMRSKVKTASTADRLQALRDEQETAAANRQRLQAEIDSLQSDLTQAEQRLAKAAARKQTAKSKFAFLPFDGRSGTTKRPILIECTQDAIRFLPEDVRVNLADLKGFTIGFNPVLMASRELVHFWTAFERVYGSADDPQEAYVLLLVRPDGIRSFDMAKQMLVELKVPHGYELLDDNMELELAAVNPEAKKVCEQAVARSFSERMTVMSVLQSRGLWRDAVNGTGPSIDGSRSLRGTVQTQNGPVPFSAAEAQAAARRSAFETGRGARPIADDSTSELNGELDESRGSLTKPGTAGNGTGSTNLADGAGSGRRGNSTSRFGSSREELDGELPIDEPLPGAAGLASEQHSNDGSRPFPFSNGRKTGSRTSGVPSGQKEPSVAGSRQANNSDDVDPHADPNRAATAGSRNSKGKSVARISGDSESARGSVSKTFDGKKKQSDSDTELRKRLRKYALLQPGIGLEKAIPIRIWADRIVVSGEYEIPVDRQLRSDNLADRVLLAIDQVQSAWPSAGKGYHWVPTLRYEVVPGGEQLQQRLNAVLFDLGMTAKVEYLPTDPEPVRKTARSQDGGGAR